MAFRLSGLDSVMRMVDFGSIARMRSVSVSGGGEYLSMSAEYTFPASCQAQLTMVKP